MELVLRKRWNDRTKGRDCQAPEEVAIPRHLEWSTFYMETKLHFEELDDSLRTGAALPCSGEHIEVCAVRCVVTDSISHSVQRRHARTAANATRKGLSVCHIKHCSV